MPSPRFEPFLDCLRKSGLLDDGTVSAYLERLQQSGSMPPDAKSLAAMMVRDALISQFQADQLLAGKWRGFHVAKYRVLEKIGIGGMGQVYLAEHKFMKHRVALKVLPRSKSADPSSLERFYREAKAGAALDHPNLVRSYDIDFDQASDLHYLVMEYVDGVNLQDLVKLRGPIDPPRAAHYIYQAALGLEHAHECGLIHRDIKPSNLLVDRQGNVKILDMGLARFFNDEQDMITKKYDESVLGTADYLAPEQAVDSHSVDVRADIYSLGCSFYFILSGYPPFPEGTVAQKLIWHQTRTPKSILEYCPKLPADIHQVLEKMMAKSVADRYQTPGEVAKALEAYGKAEFPPPDDEVLPRLSPLARRLPGEAATISVSSGGSGSQRSRDKQAGAAVALAEADATGAGNGQGDGNALATRHSSEASRETLTQAEDAARMEHGPANLVAPLPPKAAPTGGVREKVPLTPPPLPLKTSFEVGESQAAHIPVPPTVKTNREALAKLSSSREMPAYKPVPAVPIEAREPVVRVEPPPSHPGLPPGSTTRWIWVIFGIVLVLIVLLLNITIFYSYVR